MTTIIERDIAFYQAEVERLRENLRRCEAAHKAFWRVQKLLAEHVVRALREYAGEVAPATAHALGLLGDQLDDLQAAVAERGPTSTLLDRVSAELRRNACLCRIGWINERGEATHDDNPAIGRVICRAHMITVGPGRRIEIPDSQWFPICAEHARRLKEPGMHDWEIDLWYGDADRAIIWGR